VSLEGGFIFPVGRFVFPDVLSRRLFSHRTFCPSGCFVPPDVFSRKMFFPGCFVSPDVFSHERFVTERFVAGRFVWAPKIPLR
jgi:hypothetical protein